MSDSIGIEFSNLTTYYPYKTKEKLPIASLDMSRNATGHIHGNLQISINGQVVPLLDNGLNDLCFGEIISEFSKMIVELYQSKNAKYIYVEAEQGGKVFYFQRQGDDVELIIKSNEISVFHERFDFRTFRLQFEDFYFRFYQEINNQTDQLAFLWFKRFVK